MKCEIPENLNVLKLVDELAAAGIEVAGAVYEDGKMVGDNRFFIKDDNLLTFELASGDEDTAAAIVAAHLG